jgi:hypothetical protein
MLLFRIASYLGDTLIINRCRIGREVEKEDNSIDISLNLELPE